MANPTTNFGWVMPTSTDLVTDLPADFAVFGQAVDTSMADLKGGTTGQVLAKATNTDMDFTWVAQDDSNAIQNTIVDAKGDLIAASGSDVPARLAVGNNGETLVADSSTSTGLRYQAPYSQQPVLNSAMQIWQRGTSFTTTSSTYLYGADRWDIYSGTTGRTYSRQVTGDTTNLPNIQYCQRVARNSGNTNTTDLYLWSDFESVNSIPFAGKTVTLSFYARAGANYSAASGALTARLVSGTGTDQNYIHTGYTGQANVISQNATLTTTWQRFQYSATVGTTATQLGIFFGFTPVGTAGANDYYELTGIQLELGSVAQPFHTYAATIQGELDACMRYFQLIKVGQAWGTFYSTSAAALMVGLPVPMRVTPTATFSTNYTNAITEVGVTDRTPTAYAAYKTSAQAYSFLATGMTSAVAQNGAVWIGAADQQLSSEL